MNARAADAYPATDREIPELVAELGLDGIVDLHVHALPDRLQAAVWRYFDRLDDPPWPIRYRDEVDERLDHLRAIGVRAHTALAYAHRPGMLRWLNDFTLDLADRHGTVVPTFTIFPEPEVGEVTSSALRRGGQVVKVHLQVGRFHATDPRLDPAWEQIAAARAPVMLHATAVYGVEGGEQWCGLDEVRGLLDRHPDLVLVLAHLGLPDHAGAVALAEQTPGLYLDLSMTLLDGPLSAPVDDDLLGRIRDLAPRLVWGTDHPSIPHTYADALRTLARLQLTDAQLVDVLSRTGQALLDGVRPHRG